RERRDLREYDARSLAGAERSVLVLPGAGPTRRGRDRNLPRRQRRRSRGPIEGLRRERRADVPRSEATIAARRRRPGAYGNPALEGDGRGRILAIRRDALARRAETERRAIRDGDRRRGLALVARLAPT